MLAQPIMPTDLASTSAPRVPCALQHYLRQTTLRVPGHTISQAECQMAFQHWVAYIRGSDIGDPSDATAKEHLRCPLLWCRENFDSLAPTLQHVSQCPSLSNAWYWCPYCCRPENFKASEEQCAEPQQQGIKRKDSKLKRAVTFFKHLGLKSCLRHKISGASSTYDIESFDMWLAKRQRSEMEDTSHDTIRRAELADSSNDIRCRGAYAKRKENTVYEVEDTNVATSQGSNHLSQYARETNSTLQICELDAEPPTTVGTGAQFDATPHDIESMEEVLVSPVSIDECSFAHQSAESTTSHYYELESAIPAHNAPDAMLLPEIVNRRKCQANVVSPYSGLPLSLKNDDSLCNVMTLSTHSQIKELCGIVRVLNEEWLQRCQSRPDLLIRASALSPRSLVDEGTQTLQLIFRGVVPKTFDAVFALTHVACSAAYIIHEDDSSYRWNEFFQQILRLQDLIQNGSDARIFVQLVDLLRWRDYSSAEHLGGNYFLDESRGSLVPLRKSVVGLGGFLSTGAEATDVQAPQYSTELAMAKILDILKKGAVIEECSRFLDGVEYACISARSKRCPTHLPWYAQNHVTSIEELLMTIIYPLQHCHGIEALHAAIDDTAKDLNSGSLRTVREVEASLISNGKASCLSSKVYQRYLDLVTSICDHVMHEAGSDWRDRYYATDIDVVLASLVEMDNRQQLDHPKSRRRHHNNVNAMHDSSQMRPESIPTPSPVGSHTFMGSSLSKVSSPTLTGDYSPTTLPSPTTSPESSFSAPTPSSTSPIVRRCPLCPALFTGSARDSASNLRRHMRTTRDHGNAVGLVCMVCGSTISRSDNLNKHMRTVHGDETGATLRRTGARKRRRDCDGAE